MINLEICRTKSQLRRCMIYLESMELSDKSGIYILQIFLTIIIKLGEKSFVSMIFLNEKNDYQLPENRKALFYKSYLYSLVHVQTIYVLQKKITYRKKLYRHLKKL